jgi:hypothetical protein
LNRTYLLLLALTVASCAYQSAGVYERPDGSAFKTPNQPRIASASHWRLVADNEAKLLKQRIADKPIIVEQNHASNFSDTYHNLLTSSLVSKGALVLTADKYDSVKVSYNVNIINHDWGKQAPDLADQNPGLGLTAFAYYVFSEAVGLTKVPPAVFAEQMVKNLSSATEVVITTRAIYNDELLYSSSNVYYIDGINQMEYVETPYTKTTAPVSGFKAGNTVHMKVVGDRS